MLITSANYLHGTSRLVFDSTAGPQSLTQWTHTSEPSQDHWLRAHQHPRWYNFLGCPSRRYLHGWFFCPFQSHLKCHLHRGFHAWPISSCLGPFPSPFFLSPCPVSFSAWTFSFLCGVLCFLLIVSYVPSKCKSYYSRSLSDSSLAYVKNTTGVEQAFGKHLTIHQYSQWGM